MKLLKKFRFRNVSAIPIVQVQLLLEGIKCPCPEARITRNTECEVIDGETIPLRLCPKEHEPKVKELFNAKKTLR